MPHVIRTRLSDGVSRSGALLKEERTIGSISGVSGVNGIPRYQAHAPGHSFLAALAAAIVIDSPQQNAIAFSSLLGCITRSQAVCWRMGPTLARCRSGSVIETSGRR